ncbi:TPR domain protein [Akanthomyces lecanii RCEF 1005]|uniref:TPR domain protein n=1 Tax=Akanthomyces lecanii RCEF 1005 TaxID=1081108 RepID=A0A162KRM7_CORDF|nr:TPR domain protein [Akanthomyces lecanii RCEF 1005]
MANYGLGDFSKCRDTLLLLIDAFPKEPAGESALARVDARLHEQATGQYAFTNMYQQAKSSGPVDCASFYGPVEAFAFGRSSYQMNETPSFFGRRIRSVVDTKEKVLLVSQIHQKLLHNPETSRPILELFADSGDFERNMAAPGPGHEPVLDSFLVNSIVDFNTALYLAMVPGRLSEADHSVPLGPFRHGSHEEIPAGNSVWLKASSMNHACYPNCSRVFIGDMVIVRAARDLAAGTELSVAYSPPVMLETASQVKYMTMAAWEFTCTCHLCEARQHAADQAADGQRTIIKDSTEAISHSTPPANSEHGMRLYSDIVAKYPSYAGPNLAPCIKAWPLVWFHELSLRTLNKGPEAVIDGIAGGLRVAGFVVSYSRDKFEIEKWGMLQSRLPEILARLYQAYRRVKLHVCPAIKKYARTAFFVMTGEDETFGQMFPTLAKE